MSAAGNWNGGRRGTQPLKKISAYTEQYLRFVESIQVALKCNEDVEWKEVNALGGTIIKFKGGPFRSDYSRVSVARLECHLSCANFPVRILAYT